MEKAFGAASPKSAPRSSRGLICLFAVTIRKGVDNRSVGVSQVPLGMVSGTSSSLISSRSWGDPFVEAHGRAPRQEGSVV